MRVLAQRRWRSCFFVASQAMAVVLADASPRGANFSGPANLVADICAPFVSEGSGFQLGAYTPTFEDPADSTLTPNLFLLPGLPPLHVAAGRNCRIWERGGRGKHPKAPGLPPLHVAAGRLSYEISNCRLWGGG